MITEYVYKSWITFFKYGICLESENPGSKYWSIWLNLVNPRYVPFQYTRLSNFVYIKLGIISISLSHERL